MLTSAHRRAISTLAGMVVLFSQPGLADFQTVGIADISQPPSGAALAGIVTIEGTADHPAFGEYRLEFAFHPNPTETWFPLGEPVETPVFRGRLGLWDTTQIADGEYDLRLIVRLEDGTTATAVVESLRVRNSSLAETNTPPAVPATEAPTKVLPTPSPTATSLPGRQGTGSERVAWSFALGTLASAATLLSLALYLGVRNSTRARVGSLRMRHVLWKSRRRRRKGRSS